MSVVPIVVVPPVAALPPPPVDVLDIPSLPQLHNKESLLSHNLRVDIMAATIAAFSTAPVVAAFDKAVIQNANGTDTLWNSLHMSMRSMVGSPHKYLKSPQFKWLFGVYGATYLAANATESFCKYLDRSHKTPVLVASSVTNSYLSLAKDSALAKMYGAIPPTRIPKVTLGLWFTRDVLTMACVFTLPPQLSAALQSRGFKKGLADTTAQITTPVAVQTVTTVLHLNGLDIYNNPTRNIAERLAFLRREYTPTLVVRFGRAFAPYALGALFNKKLRALLSK